MSKAESFFVAPVYFRFARGVCFRLRGVCLEVSVHQAFLLNRT